MLDGEWKKEITVADAILREERHEKKREFLKRLKMWQRWLQQGKQ